MLISSACILIRKIKALSQPLNQINQARGDEIWNRLFSSDKTSIF